LNTVAENPFWPVSPEKRGINARGKKGEKKKCTYLGQFQLIWLTKTWTGFCVSSQKGRKKGIFIDKLFAEGIFFPETTFASFHRAEEGREGGVSSSLALIYNKSFPTFWNFSVPYYGYKAITR